MKYFFLIVMLSQIFSCRNSKAPSNVLSQEKMETLLWEQMKADAFTKEYVSKDPSKNLLAENIKLQQKIFSRYNVDKNDFYESYHYYLEHDEAMKTLLDSIVAKQTRIHQKAFEKRMSDNSSIMIKDPFKLMDVLKPAKKFQMQDDTFKINENLTPKDNTIDVHPIKLNSKLGLKSRLFSRQSQKINDSLK
jgi:Domain of unknown function (DUF4296)